MMRTLCVGISLLIENVGGKGWWISMVSGWRQKKQEKHMTRAPSWNLWDLVLFPNLMHQSGSSQSEHANVKRAMQRIT
jgi:hypothetical protein